MNVGSVNNIAPAGLTDVSTPRALNESQRTMIQAVKAINASGGLGQDHELTYTVDRAARLVVVRLVSKDTGNVIQQIPSEYVLRMAEELNKG